MNGDAPQPAPRPSEPKRALFGCVQRRPLWVPTWRGWLLALTLVLMLGFAVVKTLPGFLSAHAPIEAGVLVVEGWITDYALEAAIVEFKQGPYQRIYVTGGPLEKGLPLSQFKTYADLGASVLVGLGMDKQKVQPVPAQEVRADRTYNSARALRNYFQQNPPASRRINVISVGPHSRRTRLLFKKAFADDWQIGIISVPDRSYDLRRWYRSSNGVRNVMSETIAFIYAKVFFHPPKPQKSKELPRKTEA